MSHKPECNEKWEYDKDHCICSWIEKTEQRIIKLLEQELWKLPNGMPAGGKTYLSIEEAIALIKGENK